MSEEITNQKPNEDIVENLAQDLNQKRKKKKRRVRRRPKKKNKAINHSLNQKESLEVLIKNHYQKQEQKIEGVLLLIEQFLQLSKLKVLEEKRN